MLLHGVNDTERNAVKCRLHLKHIFLGNELACEKYGLTFVPCNDGAVHLCCESCKRNQLADLQDISPRMANDGGRLRNDIFIWLFHEP